MGWAPLGQVSPVRSVSYSAEWVSPCLGGAARAPTTAIFGALFDPPRQLSRRVVMQRRPVRTPSPLTDVGSMVGVGAVRPAPARGDCPPRERKGVPRLAFSPRPSAAHRNRATPRSPISRCWPQGYPPICVMGRGYYDIPHEDKNITTRGWAMSGRTSHEEMLRQRARARLKSGALHTRAAVASYAGPGSGAPCALCDEPIVKADIEFELDFPADAAGASRVTIHMHFRCRAIWDTERAAAGRSAEQTSQPSP
jgi:hypothetical protein